MRTIPRFACKAYSKAGLEYAFQAMIKTRCVVYEPGVTKNVVKKTTFSQVAIHRVSGRSAGPCPSSAFGRMLPTVQFRRLPLLNWDHRDPFARSTIAFVVGR